MIEQSEETATTEVASITIPDGGTDKILVVDDEPDFELLIRQRMRKRIKNGWVFQFARNGEEALARLHEDTDIALVLTDINMPRMDGLTLLARMHEFDRLLRAVVVSAYGDMKNIRTAMNRGAFDFVTKPIDFDDLDATIEKSLSDIRRYRKAAEAERRLTAMKRELEAAQRIQEAALPKSFPVTDELEVHGFMIPAREVGGDFYDFYFLDDYRLGFVIGDVAGKGLSAAMFMTVTRSLLKAIAIAGEDPHLVVRELNKLLHPESVAEMFVTVIYGIIDIRNGKVVFCNAGHNLPYVRRADGTIQQVERAGGVALCIVPDFNFRANDIRLEAGDLLFLYTDGVTEARDPTGSMLGDDRLSEALRPASEDSAGLIRTIVDTVSDFVAGAEQSDDLTALVVRYKGSERNRS